MSEQMTTEQLEPVRRSSGLAQPVVLCLLLAAVTLTVYWPVMRCNFVRIRRPGLFCVQCSCSDRSEFAERGLGIFHQQTANWHPLTWLSLMLDANMLARERPGPHFTNLLFHLANTVLVFLLLRRLTAANWRSAFVAALFALHPLHVESVAWISERKDVLSTFFGLLSLIAYARYVTSDRRQVTRTESALSRVSCHVSLFYWLALLFFAFGLMAKPMLVTLPFLMLLLDYWPLQRVAAGDLRFAIGVWFGKKFRFLS